MLCGEGGSLKQALALRKLNTPEITSNPLADVQNAFKSPSLQDAQLANHITRSAQRGADLGPLKLSDTLTPEYKARQVELNSTFKDIPVGPTDTPLTMRTLQDSIDTSMGISNSNDSIPRVLNSSRELDAQSAFGKPRELRKYGITTSEDKALSELQDGIKVAQEFSGSNKLINDFAGEGFTNAAAMDNILHYTGVDLPKLLSNWEKTQNVRGPLTQSERIMGRKAGVIPPLKQREGFPQSELLSIQPQQRMTLSGSLPPVDAPLGRSVKQLTPIKRESLQWTNRDGIASGTTHIKPIPAEQTLADALKGRDGQGYCA